MTSLPSLTLHDETDALSPPRTPFSEPWLINLRRAMGRRGTTPILMTGFAISRAEHEAIRNQRSTLARRTTSGANDRPAIGVELAKLIAAFPTQDPGMTASLRIEAYSDALHDAPAWAVHEARLRIVRGAVEGLDKRFAPTPPQLAEIVAGILRPLRDDLSTLCELEAIGVIEEPSEEERARVASGFVALAEELGKESAATVAARARASLETRAGAMGLDRSAIDALPDAPPRSGALDKLAVKGA